MDTGKRKHLLALSISPLHYTVFILPPFSLSSHAARKSDYVRANLLSSLALALQRGERSMNGFHDPNETSLPPRFIRTGDHGDRAIVLAQVPSRTRTMADLSPASLLYGKCSAGPPPPTRPPSSSRSGLVAESHSKADRNEWIRDRRC